MKQIYSEFEARHEEDNNMLKQSMTKKVTRHYSRTVISINPWTIQKWRQGTVNTPLHWRTECYNFSKLISLWKNDPPSAEWACISPDLDEILRTTQLLFSLAS